MIFEKIFQINICFSGILFILTYCKYNLTLLIVIFNGIPLASEVPSYQVFLNMGYSPMWAKYLYVLLNSWISSHNKLFWIVRKVDQMSGSLILLKMRQAAKSDKTVLKNFFLKKHDVCGHVPNPERRIQKAEL